MILRIKNTSVKVETVDIDSIMSKAVKKDAIGYWCESIMPIDTRFHPEISRHITAGRNLIFKFHCLHDGIYSEILTGKNFMEGLKMWLNNDADKTVYDYGTLRHTKIGYEAADKIIQYALFKKIQYTINEVQI